MERKMIYKAGIVAVAAFISLAVLVSFSKQKITSSESAACKESMDECSQKPKKSDTGGAIDFENISGKFFSTLSY
jgi:hypothetical protein